MEISISILSKSFAGDWRCRLSSSFNSLKNVAEIPHGGRHDRGDGDGGDLGEGEGHQVHGESGGDSTEEVQEDLANQIDAYSDKIVGRSADWHLD